MKNFKGIWIPKEVLTNKKLNDKEKLIYSMIISLSKNNECTMSNTYIGNLLNICNVQVSRIVNSLKKKGYIKIEMIYKENSKQMALRKIRPINQFDNTYKQKSTKAINENVKDIKYNNTKINNKSISHYKNERDYSKFDWSTLYSNIL